MILQQNARQLENKKLPSLIAPAISGLTLITAYPPFEQGYLAWFAMVPLLWFCLQAPPKRALLGGFIFGLPLHLYLNMYLAAVLKEHLSTLQAYLALFLLVVVISFGNALFAAAVSGFNRCRFFSSALIFIIPALWLIMEYTRCLGFIGYNVGYLGYTQWQYPAILNLTSVYGYWGLPFMMIAWQSLAVLTVMKLLKARSAVTGAVALALLMLLGLAFPSLFPAEKDDKTLWAALIQGNSTPEEILSDKGRKVILSRYLEMTRRAKEAEPRLQLVVWPETVVDLQLGGKPFHRPEMKALAEELNLNILYGARTRDEEKLYNSIVLLAPGSDLIQLYHKQRLVPFAEYFPLHEQLNQMLKLDLLLGQYTAGREQTIFKLGDTSLAAVVCFESYFGGVTRQFSRQGGQHLFVLTNDVWFGESIGLEQHVQAAAIRAAEMGIAVTQVANSGITASFDYRGRELFRSGKAEADTFILPLELTRRKTIYTLAGDYFPAFWAAFLAAAAMAPAVKKHRLKKSRTKTFD